MVLRYTSTGRPAFSFWVPDSHVQLLAAVTWLPFLYHIYIVIIQQIECEMYLVNNNNDNSRDIEVLKLAFKPY